MKSIRVRSFALLFVVLLSFYSLAIFDVKAQPRTIIVPDDYATIQEAIDATKDGDIVFVKEGTYEEPKNQTLTITKNISLIAENPGNTTINLHPQKNTYKILHETFTNYDNPLTIKANYVKIQGFKITTDGGSINVTGNHNQIIQNKICSLAYISGYNNTVIANIMERVYLTSFHSGIISNNSFIAIRIGRYDPCNYNIISKNKIEGTSYQCIEISGSSHNIFTANHIVNFDENYSGIGVSIYNTSNNTFFRNNFIKTRTPVSVQTDVCVWDFNGEGNYWSDYDGVDWNRDGIGDTSFQINDNNVDNFPLIRPFDLESFSVDVSEWVSSLPILPSTTPTSEPETIVGITIIILFLGTAIVFFLYLIKKK